MAERTPHHALACSPLLGNVKWGPLWGFMWSQGSALLDACCIFALLSCCLLTAQLPGSVFQLAIRHHTRLLGDDRPGVHGTVWKRLPRRAELFDVEWWKPSSVPHLAVALQGVVMQGPRGTQLSVLTQTRESDESDCRGRVLVTGIEVNFRRP